MNPLRIAVVVGSIRQDSYSRRFAQALARLAPDDVEFDFIRIDDLPHYNQDHDGHDAPETQRLKRAIEAADGVLFVTPEYSRSIPGVLKNALDLGARPYGQSKWAGKPAAAVGVSPGAMAGSMAVQHLRNVLAAMDMRTLAGPEMYIHWQDGLVDAEGRVGEGARAFAQHFMDTFIGWVRRFA
jgi:chromate reductase